MTPSQLPVGLRTQQTIAAFYRAGYPIEEIADAIALAPSTCEDLVEAMRRAGWIGALEEDDIGAGIQQRLDRFCPSNHVERAQARVLGQSQHVSGGCRARTRLRDP